MIPIIWPELCPDSKVLKGLKLKVA